MLATRIIPTILSKNGNLVKGEGFKADRIVGNALQAARIHAMRSVDELVIFNLDDDAPDYDMIRKLTEGCFTPVTVGGGVKSVEDVQKLLKAGADKVCIGGMDWDLMREASRKFGKQCVMVSIDYGEGGFISGWEDGLSETIEDFGAGEILLQSVERDGTMQGYDLELIKAVSEAVSIPVIASGGCSGYEDMYNAIEAGASAVAVGALFLFTDATPKGAAEYLHERGVETRL